MRAGRTLCPSDIESHFFLRGMKSLSALFFSRLLVLALVAQSVAGCRYGVALSSAGFIQHSVDLSTAENVISDGSGPQCVQVLPGQSLTQFLLQRASACRFSGSGCSAFTLTAQPGEQGYRSCLLRNVTLNQVGGKLTEVTYDCLGTWVLVSGSVVAWGGNTFQQTNVPREALSSIAAVAAGHAHSLALTARTGAVLAWGGGYDEQTIVPRVAQSGAVAVAAGASQSLALLGNGTVIAWGKGGEAVVPFAAQSNVVAIAAGSYVSLALLGNGTVVSWWRDGYDQYKVPDDATANVVAIDAGAGHCMALLDNGTAVSWGRSPYGDTIVPLQAQSGVVAIATGYYHCLARRQNGAIIAWGYNAAGQTNVPGSVRNATLMGGGLQRSYALLDTGRLIAWGNLTGYSQGPDASGNVVSFSAGAEHVLAIVPPGRPPLPPQPPPDPPDPPGPPWPPSGPMLPPMGPGNPADQGRPPEPPPLTNGSVKVPGRFSVGPTPPTDGEASEYHTPAAVIIGVTVGGAVAVAIAFLSFVLYCMRRRAGQESGLLESAMRASRAPSATSDKGAAGAAGKAARNGSTDAAVYVCDACGKPSSGRVSEPGSTNTNGDWVQVRAAPPGAADAADDSSHLSPAARLSGVSAHTSSPSGQSSGDQTPVPPPALVRARSSHRSGLSASSPSTSSPSHPAGQAQEENGGVVTRGQGGDICLTITEKSETLESLLLAAEHEAQGGPPVALTQPRVVTHLRIQDLTLLKQLTEGSSGVKVYKASLQGQDAPVVAKLHTVSQLSTEALQGFRQQATVLSSLTHPNLAIVHGVIDDSETYGVVVRYYRESSLYVTMTRKRYKRVPMATRLELAEQVATTMAWLHDQGITHGRLNGSNLLLEDGFSRVVIANCAAPAAAYTSAAAQDAVAIITPPEQLAAVSDAGADTSGTSGTSGSTDVSTQPTSVASPAGDVYAFAFVLLELVSGKRAYEGIGCAAIRTTAEFGARPAIPDTVPAPVARVIVAAWAQHPADRPSMSRLVTLLRAAINKCSEGKPTPTEATALHQALTIT